MKSRGYEVIFFNMSITRSLISSAGLSFSLLESVDNYRFDPINRDSNHPGPNTLNVIDRLATLVLTRARQQLLRYRIQGLLVDQAELAASSIAESLGLPFASLSFFPPVYLDDESPPFIFGWPPTEGQRARRRNRRGNALLRRLVEPTLRRINSYRETQGLQPLNDLNDVFSKCAILSQVPQALDFRRTTPPSSLVYTGQWVNKTSVPSKAFPWHRLNGKPVIYACLGTVRSETPATFTTIATAVADFDAQLVISLGGMRIMPDDLQPLPNNPIVVHYAPQRELLKRSSAVIYHGGMNTTLEAAIAGVPTIAIPITDDQPGVAARVTWQGIGIAIPYRHLTTARLTLALKSVLYDSCYRSAVGSLQREICSIDGLSLATEAIDKVFAT
jgi:zeaxanthin glucosyltransferase